MNLIKDIELLNGIIQKYFSKNTFTNNYLLSSAYSQYIADKKLYFVKTASNAIILVEKADFYQLYYYINNQNELVTFNIDRPLTMEILYRGEAQRPYEVLSFWEKCGFRQHLTRDMMTASYRQLILPPENASNIHIKYAETEKEIIYSKELIETTFDKYTGDVLTSQEIYSFAENKNIICAYLEEKLCGILQFEIKNNVVWLGHIAVAPQFRGFGIANALVKSYISMNMKQPDTRYQLWVIQDNTKATTLYNKFGFVYGNKTSASMLKDY